MSDPIIALRNIHKAFFGVGVLRDVTFEIAAGSTLGLVGENGAGKSTLMNILGGNLSCDSGEILLNGLPFEPRSPRDADEAGLAFIHQELNLFPNLSIAENLFLTHFPQQFGWIRHREAHRRTAELLRRVGLNVKPQTKVESLSAGERQLVEIAKALHHRSQIIIFDEPTTSLAEQETQRLFQLIRSLQTEGIAMVYISHALGDVQQLCDHVVILRDGSVVGSGPIDQYDTPRMVNLMVGRTVDQLFPASTSTPSGEKLLSVRDVTRTGVVRGISFDLHRGETLGIAGLMGSGRTELARILFGLDRCESGTIQLGGAPVTHLDVRGRIAQGLAMLTESRREDGLFMHASISENLSIVAAPRFANRLTGWIRQTLLNDQIEAMSRSVGLRGVVDRRQPVRTLSGGNQQKIVLGKWLMDEPQVLILDEPTRGIDVGAKYEIYSLIDRLAAGGSGILVISSEIDELVGICDRILVMSQGEIRDQLDRDSFDRQRILHAGLHSDALGELR